MPNTTPLAVELYQRAGDGLVPLLVRASGGDTTDIEALIAAAIKQHNEDPEAHPDIRQAIKEAGGGLVSTPVLTLPDRLPLGSPAPLKMAAAAGLNGARIVSFSVTVGDAEPVEVAATDNAATYTFTPAGNDGDTVTVRVTAVDNFGNRSKAGTAEAILYIKRSLLFLGGSATTQNLLRSPDNGLTWEAPQTVFTTQYGIRGLLRGRDGVLLAVSYNAAVRRSTDNGLTWENAGDIALIGNPTASVVADNGAIILGGMVSGNNPAVYRSLDNGLTWEAIDTLPFFNIYKVIRAFNGTLLILGRATSSIVSYVCRSTDNGDTWETGGDISSSSYTSLGCLPDGTLVMGNNSSFAKPLMHSTDYGATWTEGVILASVQALHGVSTGTLIAASSEQGVLRSTNKGATWNLTSSTTAAKTIYLFTETEDGTLYAGGGSGSSTYLLRSTDDGLTWETVRTTSIGRISAILSVAA